MPIKIEIITQERQVYSDEVDIVVAPGVEGEMGILPNHAPLITALSFGELKIRKGDEEQHFAIGGGVLEVRPDKVIVLADAAEHSDDIDIENAEAARQRAEQVMLEGPPEDPEAYAQLEAALRRSELRVRVARRRQHLGGPPTIDTSGDSS